MSKLRRFHGEPVSRVLGTLRRERYRYGIANYHISMTRPEPKCRSREFETATQCGTVASRRARDALPPTKGYWSSLGGLQLRDACHTVLRTGRNIPDDLSA